MSHWKLIRVFISSTADLTDERQAVDEALTSLMLDANRFESWPSSPDGPIETCLSQVAESEALVLLLGCRYGTLEKETGLSVTHLEYRKAMELGLPVFAFILPAEQREPGMERFIQEVNGDLFRVELDDADQLGGAVKRSFLAHFTKCFREYHHPSETLAVLTQTSAPDGTLGLPRGDRDARRFLQELYRNGRDAELYSLRSEVLERFSPDDSVANLLHMAATNLGMQDGDVELRDVRAAIEFWENARAEEEDSGLLYNLGNAYSILGRRDAAITAFESATRHSDCPPQCFVNLGNEYRDTDLARAEEAYAEALKRTPHLFQAKFCLATLYVARRSNPTEGLRLLESIDLDSLAPRHVVSVSHWKATAQLALGQHSAAIDSIESSLRDHDNYTNLWELAARLYAIARRSGEKQLSEILGFWRRFTARFPDCGEGWAELGYSLWSEHVACKTALPEEARAAFERALDLGFFDGGLVADKLGHYHQQLGDWLEAEKAYRRAEAEDSANFGYCLGVSLVFQDKFAEALPFVLAAANEHQPDGLSWFQVGKCYFGLRDYERAIQAYERSAALDPSYGNAQFDLGGALFQAGRFEDARKVWAKALRNFPGHSSAMQARAFLERLPG